MSDSLPPLRWLRAADVDAAMPPLTERLELAELTMVALATPDGAEMPPKLGVHPRPAGSWLHAMPAYLHAADPAGDLIGMKWVSGFATNNEKGLSALNALVVVNDSETGVPVAVMDGGPITAQRTAAVSGIAIRAFAPPTGGRPTDVALIGAGAQGRSHLPVLGHLLPGLNIAIFDRHPERADELASLARATDGIGTVQTAKSAREAIEEADVVVTAASFTSRENRQVMTPDWLRPESLLVPVDYATYCSAEVARSAALFVVDHREQFLANRDAGNFDGYPDPTTTLGEAVIAGTRRPAGRVVVTHLGVGLADVVFANAILARADRDELGLELPR
jgi:ornithine cyclodeaminase/alanine dehydrogenase-like protein (mu-crystallin family)